MNRQQKRLERKLKSNGNSPNSHSQQLQTLSLPSLQELKNLENISMEDLTNMPQELKELLQSQPIQEQSQLKPKRQYKKRSSQQTDTSGLEESGTNDDQAPKRPKQTAKQKRIADGLTGLLGTTGMALVTASKVSGKQVLALDGFAVLNSAQPIADNLIEVAKQYPKMMFALEKVVEGSAIAGLVGAVGGLATAIGLNHGWIKQDALSGFFDQSQASMETGTTFNA
jgi:hypothetical protein